MKLERRHLTQEFRVSGQGESPKIAGYAAVFDSPSEDLGWIEQIDPHAFDSVLAGQHDVRCLWNHDDNVVLGRESAGTLRLSVDARGLAYECDLPDTQAGRDLLISMRRKDIRESSFGFICKRDQWTENADGTVTRRILEFDALLDVSPVAFPAFPAASVGVRSLPSSMPVEIRSKLEKRDAEDGDGNDNGCNCECPECVANDCLNCSDSECEDPNCLANQDSYSSRALTDQCICTCAQCMAQKCGICSADPACKGAERSSADWHTQTMLRLRLAEAE